MSSAEVDALVRERVAIRERWKEFLAFVNDLDDLFIRHAYTTNDTVIYDAIEDFLDRVHGPFHDLAPRKAESDE